MQTKDETIFIIRRAPRFYSQTPRRSCHFFFREEDRYNTDDDARPGQGPEALVVAIIERAVGDLTFRRAEIRTDARAFFYDERFVLLADALPNLNRIAVVERLEKSGLLG